MNKWLKNGIFASALLSTYVHAGFLTPDQAFQFQAVSTSDHQAELSWKIADGYYLYHDQIKVKHGQNALKLQLPKAEDKDDPNFGLTQVHYHQVKTNLDVQPNQKFQVQWQGCSESGLCYPIQRISIATDADGLFPAQQNMTENNRHDFKSAINNQSENQSQMTDQSNQSKIVDQSPDAELNPIKEQNNVNEESIQKNDQFESSFWNNDQYFLNLLTEQGIWLNLLVFLGLGVLLAFLPCSLPLIPILSGILVHNAKRSRATVIALVFVLGVAIVYALMGLAVAQLGYSFQRSFQSPIFISIFSILFILFALNLFGAFQLSLPQSLIQRLDRIQQNQKGGTVVGAGIMGMVAALIVGPCMSAPLAGALIYVSQLNQPVVGASYLFILGIGVGLPLFIASVFGAKHLPKPGQWMDRLKFSFGFVMLGLAVYFARPLISNSLYLILMAAVFGVFSGYLFYKLIPNIRMIYFKVILIIVGLLTVFAGSNYIYQLYNHSKITKNETLHPWYRVESADSLQQILAQNSQRAVVIDVYADWCVACQPIEKEVLPREDVQMMLKDVVRIKLDLTRYHQSQDQLLKDWQILGPPTFIFLDENHQEQRDLRLTGTFTAQQLLKQLKRVEGVSTP